MTEKKRPKKRATAKKAARKAAPAFAPQICIVPSCAKEFTPTRARQKKCDNCKNHQRDARQGPNQRRKKVDPATTEQKTHEGLNGVELPSGLIGNRGNPIGRPRNELRKALGDIVALGQDEVIRRLQALTGKGKRAKREIEKLELEELRKLVDTAAKYSVGIPKTKVQVGGTGDDGEIPIAVIGPRRPSKSDVARSVSPVVAAAVALGVVQPK